MTSAAIASQQGDAMTSKYVRRLAALALSTFLLACASATTGRTSPIGEDQSALDCPAGARDLSERVQQLVGAAYISNGDRASTRAMDCLMSYWQESKEGELKAEISNAILAVLYRHPEVALRRLEQSVTFYEDWNTGLHRRSFTWGLNPPCELDIYRDRIVSVLEDAKSRDHSLDVMADKVIAELKSVKCHQID